MRYLFDSYTLDPDRRELRRGAALIDIEPQVFDLLHYLLDNRERVASRDDLIASVWGGRIVSESALSSRINAARSAIGDSGADQRLIKTLPRKGIRFIGEVREEPPVPVGSDAAPAAAFRSVARDTRPLEAEHQPVSALPFPDKPSLAVLPFINMSGDPEQEYFSDGIVEDVITLLSHSRSLFVVARNSSFAYKGRTVDVKRIGRELGVRYVLEGSVRRSGKRVRVTAQLLDAETGNHLWAERFDRDLADIFAVQDEIAEAVAISIEPALTQLERLRAVRTPPESLGAWEAYQRGLWHMSHMNPEEYEDAKRLFRRAVELDPNFGAAYVRLAGVTLLGTTLFPGQNRSEELDEALALARRAVYLDRTDALGHSMVCRALVLQGDHEGGLAEARESLAINPNLALGHASLGMALLHSGSPREAIQALQEALRRDPNDPGRVIWMSNLAMAHYFLREYESAVDLAKATIRSHPGHPVGYRYLAAALGQLGCIDEAQRALQKGLAIAPNAFDAHIRALAPQYRSEDYEHMIEGLRKAGWKG